MPYHTEGFKRTVVVMPFVELSVYDDALHGHDTQQRTVHRTHMSRLVKLNKQHCIVQRGLIR